MRPLRFLVPGTGGKFRCGGLLVELQTARLISAFRPVEVVTYRCREPGQPFLADLLAQESAPGSALWIVSWGFDVPHQLRLLAGRPVAYHAHSCGYGFDLPPGVPILAVSRDTLGYWGERAPRQPLFLVPNALSSEWIVRGERAVIGPRPVDVLVQRRKNSRYVLERLVPALRARGLRVQVQDGWADDLVGLFNAATVVLYDSADYWRAQGVSEGFGLPPLEALACGCVVFSSLNHALADSLDPGMVGHQIGFGSLAADVERIVAAVADPGTWRADPARLEALLASCSEAELCGRWQRALLAIDQHWDRRLATGDRGDEAPLRRPALWRLRLDQLVRRLRGRLEGCLAPRRQRGAARIG